AAVLERRVGSGWCIRRHSGARRRVPLFGLRAPGRTGLRRPVGGRRGEPGGRSARTLSSSGAGGRVRGAQTRQGGRRQCETTVEADPQGGAGDVPGSGTLLSTI